MTSGTKTAAPSRALGGFDIALAAALPIVSQISRLSGVGKSEAERAHEVKSPVTPPDKAFGIWGPLFASAVAYAAHRRGQPKGQSAHRAEWLARTSLLGNVLWSLNAQFRGLGWASVGLLGSSAAAATQAVGDFKDAAAKGSPGAKWSARLLAPLAGWLTVASFANAETTLLTKQGGAPTETKLDGTLGRSLPILAAATTAAAAGSKATRGSLPYAAAAAWGLGGVVFKNRATRPLLAAGALAGLSTLAYATLKNRRARTTPTGAIVPAE